MFENTEELRVLFTSLSNMTRLSLSLYGEEGNIMFHPVREDKLLSAIRLSPRGSAEYDDFIKRNIEHVIHRGNISLIKGPAGQYYFFIPTRINDMVFALTGAVYLSSAEFEEFYKREALSYGLSPYELQSWRSRVSIRDYADIYDSARHIQTIFNLFLRSSYESRLNEQRYRSIKTVLSLISDIRSDIQADEVFDILVDIITFLFNVKSVSIQIKDNDILRPRKTAGILKDYLQSIPLKVTGIMSEVIENQKPLYSEDVMDILRLGFSDEITSIYAFPIISEGRIAAILNIFNSEIHREDADIILKVCRITGFILRLIELQGIYNKYISDIDLLNIAIAHMNPLKELDKLYEAIMDTTVHLVKAEKGSLMLVDEDTSSLTIKAAKGINKRLFDEIKIKAGEGIAGWVFKEGIPLIVKDIEKNERKFPRRPKYRTGSFISIPLKMGEKTIGILNISDKFTGEVFSEEDMVLLRSFASYASIALERSTYYSLAGQLKELSITDSLTGLFNRRYFEERFYEELNRSDRHNLSFSLAMLDIDDFKLFNDSEGHLAGDEILKAIAAIAKDCLRISDVIARFGGEEFAVIMPQTEKDEAFLVAERIRKSIKGQLPRSWKTFPRDTITITVGIATYPSDGKDRKELIRNTDKALYRGKMEGKDRTVAWLSKF